METSLVCVRDAPCKGTGAGVGVDSAWEQKKTEANLSWLLGQGEMLESAVESPASRARFVG